jgi:hypothetical protein
VRSTLARAAGDAGVGLLELTFELEDLQVSSTTDEMRGVQEIFESMVAVRSAGLLELTFELDDLPVSSSPVVWPYRKCVFLFLW